MAAHGFEDLKVWQLARELVRSMYVMTSRQVVQKDRMLCDQVRRAAVSSMSNVAEGFERGSKRDFVRFLYMARGSAGEVRSHLYVARDLAYINQAEFEKMKNQAAALSQGLFRFIQHLESSEAV
ncbi:four helix bundle protein [Nitrospira moscoviensis]|uniref:S23 ribosomal protein n=1 Tax=Nitrospira moscoviensis TaxID=42253 RepID=A0A0K2GFX1_NITMO|nr:four helix bundle protein [Nitrospira moscoviensis]ALA59860.1 S23 ribosomal protein [Nitrospira moscoviensis]